MTNLERSPEFPIKRHVTPDVITESLRGFAHPDQIMAVHHIAMHDTDAQSGTERQVAEAWQATLSKLPSKELAPLVIYLLDMDDTGCDYSGDKKRYHLEVAKHVFKDTSIPEEVQQRLLFYLNKTARTLGPLEIHPESYDPTLEILGQIMLKTMIEDGSFGPAGAQLNDTIASLDDDSLKDWLRQEIIGRVIDPDTGYLPTGCLTSVMRKKEGKDQQYFVESESANEILATATNTDEIASIADSVTLNAEQKQHFTGLYEVFIEHMLDITINESVFPRAEDGGWFVLATFGKSRFQLAKVRSLLSRLEEQRLRIPDEIILFTHGLKPPVIVSYLNKMQIAYPDIRAELLDNSNSQVSNVNAAGHPGLRAVLFDPKTDCNKPFRTLVGLDDETESKVVDKTAEE